MNTGRGASHTDDVSWVVGAREGRALRQIFNACGAQNLDDRVIGAANHHDTGIAM